MIRALVSGTLHGDPQTRTSRGGQPFTTGKLKADSGDGATVWVSLIAFGQEGERLATLKAGAAVSVSGRAKLSSWLGKDGSPAAGLDVTVDEVATLRGRPKPRDEGQRRPPPDRRPPAAAGFDDMDYLQV